MPKNTSTAAAQKYRCLVGFNYPDVPGGNPVNRVNAGDQDFTLPDWVAQNLLALSGVIEVYPPPPPPPPGSVSVVEEAGNLSLAHDGQVPEVKE